MTNARMITRDLLGRWYRNYGTAACPVCQPERRKDQNALTLKDGNDGRLLMHCKKSNCAFTDILAAAGYSLGDPHLPDPAFRIRREQQRLAEAAKKSRQAEHCWREALPIQGTVAETYLREARGITCRLSETLRFHPECWHGATATRHPAMVAKVDGGDAFAIHRTYLMPDGSGKAAVEPAKAMLGATAGGAVRLIEGPSHLVVAEGAETALSLASGLLCGPATVWAALSTSGMRGLRLPPTAGRLTIATDGDDAGRASGHALAERAHAKGWSVSLLPAPEGQDWNDVLIERAAV